MNEILNDLVDEIKRELQKIKRTPFIDRPVGIIEIIRALDDIFCYYSYILPKKSPDNAVYYNKFKTICNGFYECYEQLCYNEDKVQNSKLLHVSTDGSRNWAKDALEKSGTAGFISRYIRLVQQGVFTAEKKTGRVILFKCVIPSTGAEYIEAQYSKYLLEHKILLAGNKNRIKELEGLVQEELVQRVYIWNSHFIKYNTSPIIDEYFKLIAEQICNGFIGYDAFHKSSLFDDIPFGSIQEVVKGYVSSALRHLHFCFAALEKFRGVKLDQWNFYATPYNINELITSISKDINISIPIVRRVTQMLTLSHNNLNIHLGAPGSSLPPLIKIEKEWVLRSLNGFLSNPFTYLLRYLKAHCTSDYFNAVNFREEMFKDEFYSFFETGNILKAKKNIILKIKNKPLTDVDAMLFDIKSKCLLLVQLKWMDDFGTSMVQRNSMAKNFYTSSIKWIDKVDEWLKLNQDNNLLQNFDDRKNNYVVKTVKKLILGRHFSHFSDKDIDERAHWCAWPQLIQIINSIPGTKKSLPKLLKEITKQSISKVNLNHILPDTTFKLNDYSVIVSFKS